MLNVKWIQRQVGLGRTRFDFIYPNWIPCETSHAYAIVSPYCLLQRPHPLDGTLSRNRDSLCGNWSTYLSKEKICLLCLSWKIKRSWRNIFSSIPVPFLIRQTSSYDIDLENIWSIPLKKLFVYKDLIFIGLFDIILYIYHSLQINCRFLYSSNIQLIILENVKNMLYKLYIFCINNRSL